MFYWEPEGHYCCSRFHIKFLHVCILSPFFQLLIWMSISYVIHIYLHQNYVFLLVFFFPIHSSFNHILQQFSTSLILCALSSTSSAAVSTFYDLPLHKDLFIANSLIFSILCHNHISKLSKRLMSAEVMTTQVVLTSQIESTFKFYWDTQY